MQTQHHLSSAFSATATRFVPPAHVRRWTGRAAPTILLPSLAALRIAGPTAAAGAARPARA